MAEAATLTVNINEEIFLNNNYRNSAVTYTVPDVVGVDNRIINIPSGSLVELLRFSSSFNPGLAGTVISDSLGYLRLTNLESVGTLYVNLVGAISGSSLTTLPPGSSFLMNSTQLSGSVEEVAALKVFVGVDTNNPINIEYYLATTI